jgi:hypothetical protein
VKRARLNFLDSNIQKQDAGLPDDYEICKKGETLRNHALKGGRKAGAYYKIGKVETFDKCIDLCCSSEDCTLALFVKRSCYSVECESAQLCKPIRVHRAIKPSIFRRYRGRFWRNILVRMCDRIVAILLCNMSLSQTGLYQLEFRTCQFHCLHLISPYISLYKMEISRCLL